jgi:hypothetical protein
MQPSPVTITHMNGAVTAASDKQWSSDKEQLLYAGQV